MRRRSDAHGRSADFDDVFAQRIAEADEFYVELHARPIATRTSERSRGRLMPACCGASSSTTTSSSDWLDGRSRRSRRRRRSAGKGRNDDWPHLFNRDIISMPDKWEYPWFAAWDLAFHMIPFAQVDPDFAKEQLVLFLREWYMHPNGQIAGLRVRLSAT